MPALMDTVPDPCLPAGRQRPSAPADPEKPLLSHLDELRKRFLVSFVFFILAAAVSFNYSSFLFGILKRPLAGVVDKLVFFSPTEALALYLNISLAAGLMLSMPLILYQAWKFVEPAVAGSIKSGPVIFVSSVTLAFASGALFSYFILIPPALKFLLGFAGPDLEPVISAQSYVSFIVWTVLGTGLVFEMPVLSYVLSKLGVINHRSLRNKYRYAIVGILAAAAIISPTPDIFNMLLFAAPMLFLYELSIWISRFAGKRRRNNFGSSNGQLNSR
ncbi:MAG: twin-arginine translocase subunit TatC [Elusimicrobia bacterium]|nr:twin-arginine translocase subunit TatC [Elusimicrobiota bacterium]